MSEQTDLFAAETPAPETEITSVPEQTDTQPQPSYKLSIQDDGAICYQPLISNPLPGDKIAQITKGDALLNPSFDRLDSAPLTQEEVEIALTAYLQENLAILYKLPNPVESDSEAVSEIAQALYDANGMLERASVEQTLKSLSAEERAALRAKGVRFGPLYLYCPEMNKPAPLRLRAVLWGVFHEFDLPVTRIPDGMTSKRVIEADSEEALTQTQKDLYTALAYPVYGARAIRIDMLDRVVNAIYESAEKGKFKAQHAMAEWMGCPILELYEILQALGHKKIHDPAEQEQQEQQEQQQQEEPTNAEQAEMPADNVEAKPEEKTEEKAQTDKQETVTVTPPAKPELATFVLKRGRAHQQQGRSSDSKSFGKNDKGKPKSKNGDQQKSYRKPKKPKQPKRDNGPRVISAEAKTTNDSPFAVLGQLKK